MYYSQLNINQNCGKMNTSAAQAGARQPTDESRPERTSTRATGRGEQTISKVEEMIAVTRGAGHGRSAGA